jgi:hypothetical protein
MLCPSESTFILSCVFYIVGLIQLHYLNDYGPLIKKDHLYVSNLLLLIFYMNWKNILGTIQTIGPMVFWVGTEGLMVYFGLYSVVSAIRGLFLRWVAPGKYKRNEEGKEKARQVVKRKREEGREIEREKGGRVTGRGGEDSTAGEMGEVIGSEGGVTRETSATGIDFV